MLNITFFIYLYLKHFINNFKNCLYDTLILSKISFNNYDNEFSYMCRNIRIYFVFFAYIENMLIFFKFTISLIKKK